MSDSSDAADPDDGGLDGSERRRAVRERYADAATGGESCCGGSVDEEATAERSRAVGYSDDEVDAVAAGANPGLGCGNPTAIASTEAGNTVLDLGSGGGFDCFLAADEVGPDGRVIGVDMTPEMVERARENVAENDATNVEFRLGEIEHPPVADATVDVVISNCVVNLSPDESRVFRESHRVLRPGGRLAISDVVLTADVPPDLRPDPESVSACVAGAASIPALESILADAGFTDVAVDQEDSDEFVSERDDERDPSEFVAAARIGATKPAE